MTASGMARGPADEPAGPQASQEQEMRRAELLILFAAAVARCDAVTAFHRLHPPTANPDAVTAVWRETRHVVESWRVYVSRDDRWYGMGWPHDVDRTRLAIGEALARALVDGTPPTG